MWKGAGRGLDLLPGQNGWGWRVPGPIGEEARAKLVAELDRDGKWLQKAARGYRKRRWTRDVRRVLGMSLAFLMDETQVGRSTIYRAEDKETTGELTIAELEALAEAMECKLVYAIVPKRGTVAELAERKGRERGNGKAGIRD